MSGLRVNSLRVRVAAPDGAVRLRDLREVVGPLQHALSAVAVSIDATSEAEANFAITEAHTGSLALRIQPMCEEGSGLRWPTEVFPTVAADLDGIRRREYRTSLDLDVLRSYLKLVRALGARDATVEYQFRDRTIVVDGGFRSAFEIALREREVADVSFSGSLDAISAHQEPFRFHLYPKLETSGRIECRFSRDLLPVVAKLLKRVVEVRGTAYYAPVGLFPLRMELTAPPIARDFDPVALRRFVRGVDLLPRGMSPAAFIARNRRAAGLEA